MRLLMHVCCAPDATVALERLPRLERLLFWFANPNIQPQEEYERRAAAFLRLMKHASAEFSVRDDQPDEWREQVRGLENEPEGGGRCAVCIEYRLKLSAEKALAAGFDAIGTVLTTSPRKNADLVNSIGARVAQEHHLEYYPTNFKKKDGFKRSVEISRSLGLYRQNYCGCIFSIRTPRVNVSVA
jgi:predicted adenine nucleotide alpha hydrolase (AANH) superfamily ATPase